MRNVKEEAETGVGEENGFPSFAFLSVAFSISFARVTAFFSPPEIGDRGGGKSAPTWPRGRVGVLEIFRNL